MARGDRPDDWREQVDVMLAALNARDFDRFEQLASFHPEGEFHSALAVSEGEVYRGVDGMRRWAEATDATWADFRVRLVEAHPVGDDRTVLVLHPTGTARASGVPLDITTAQIWTWRGGLLVRNESFHDPREAFRAAALEYPA